MIAQLFPAMADSPAQAASSETILWKGNTSQWTHFGYYTICVLLAAACIVGAFFTGGWAAIGLIVPLVMWIVRWVITKSTQYTLTNERLLIAHGILNRREENLELYRVRDYSMEQPFALRMMGLGNIRMITSDSVTPTVSILAIPDCEKVREALRHSVEAARDRKRVRQMDMDTTDAGNVDHDHPLDDLGHHS
jgi:uncharacterized membrane protein YdbT with pleckstrin-like domain